ncbi:MAG: hypothetical protein II956_02365 [Bacteroidales bacterium]|nr:hypothetical protein [Bacteroidales bacterium]
MEEMKNQNDELQSRREFFKQAAKTALPILGAVVLSLVFQNFTLSDSLLENVKTQAKIYQPIQKIVSYYAREEIIQGARAFASDGNHYNLNFLNMGKGETNNSETIVNYIYIIPYGHVPDFGPKGYHGYPEKNKPFRVLGLKVVEENGEEKFYAHVYGNPFKVDVGTYTEHYGTVDDYIKVPRAVGRNIRKLIQGEKILADPTDGEKSRQLWGAPSVTQLEYEYVQSGAKK